MNVTESMKKRINATDQTRCNEGLIEACMTNNTPTVHKLVGMADLAYADYEALGWALRNNNLENVRAIVNASGEQHRPHIIARFQQAKKLSVDVLKLCVQYLNDSVPPHPADGYAFERQNAGIGNAGIVLDLAQRSIEDNNIAGLLYLITQCDPNSHSGRLLRTAAQEGREEMMDVLYPLSDPEKTIEAMREYINITRPNTKISLGIRRINERMEQERLRGKLRDVVDNAGKSVTRKM